jgi:hypothetical protein
MTTIYLVSNGGEYSAYGVLALFTTRELAEDYVRLIDGHLNDIEEWPTDVPKEKLISWHACLDAYKSDGKWCFNRPETVYAYSSTPTPGDITVHCELGHYSGWGSPDPKTKEYTAAYARASGQSSEQVKKMCLDAFYQKIAEAEL